MARSNGDLKRGNRNLRERELKAKNQESFLTQWERRLERAQDAYDATRPAVMAALRELCDEFGDTDWSDKTDPVEVIRHHVIAHLRRERAQAQARLEQAEDSIRRLLIATERAPVGPRVVPPPRPAPAPAIAPRAAPRPAPPKPMLPPPTTFNGATMAVTEAANGSYQAHCSCQWRGTSWERMTGASEEGRRHLERAHRAQPTYRYG